MFTRAGPVSGANLEAGGGNVGIRVFGQTTGHYDSELTLEKVRDNFATIVDTATARLMPDLRIPGCWPPVRPSRRRMETCQSATGRADFVRTRSASTPAPSVFEADLPTLHLHDITDTVHEVAPRIHEVRKRSPIAIGPLGPEVLGYELAQIFATLGSFSARHAHDGARDNVRPAINGCSAPSWAWTARNTGGCAVWCSKAFTPRASTRMEDTIDAVINELIDQVADKMAEPADAISSPTSPAYRSRSSARCWARLLRTGSSCLPCGRRTFSRS